MNSSTDNKVALIILDGWGINPDPKVSAIEAADTPFMDSLVKKFPHSVLTTFGEEVGLPDGQMGNSEVGHMNIGAGRVVYQELVRINKAFKDHEVEDNGVFLKALQHAEQHSKRIHLMGLLSDGGVHSHINHLFELCDILKNHSGVKVFIHAFMDGRDTDPHKGAHYIDQLENKIKGSNIQLASVMGRYYAMDRDKRWERTQKAYNLLVRGVGEPVEDFVRGIMVQYREKITDEFMTPLKQKSFDEENMFIQSEDVVIFFNFRTDRPRQLTHVLTQADFHEYNMYALPVYLVTFSEYDKTFKNVNVLFEKDNLQQTLGEVISDQGKKQVRIAETEKYPHVTFFFNGGREIPFAGEDRILVPSPQVATYDLKPEMSAVELTEKLIYYLNLQNPDFICLNYANTDMVGHTGVFSAAIIAAETVDRCLAQLVPQLLDKNYSILIIADHGNSDVMVNGDGSPNTAHTTNPVPIIFINENNYAQYKISSGKLADLAPTILHLMKINPPNIMSGNILIYK